MQKAFYTLFFLASQILCTEPLYETVLQGGWAKWHRQKNNIFPTQAHKPGLHIFYKHFDIDDSPFSISSKCHNFITIIAKTTQAPTLRTISLYGDITENKSGNKFTLYVDGIFGLQQYCIAEHSFSLGKSPVPQNEACLYVEKKSKNFKENLVCNLPFDATSRDRHTLSVSCSKKTPVTITLTKNTEVLVQVELFKDIQETLLTHALPSPLWHDALGVSWVSIPQNIRKTRNKLLATHMLKDHMSPYSELLEGVVIAYATPIWICPPETQINAFCLCDIQRVGDLTCDWFSICTGKASDKTPLSLCISSKGERSYLLDHMPMSESVPPCGFILTVANNLTQVCATCKLPGDDKKRLLTITADGNQAHIEAVCGDRKIPLGSYKIKQEHLCSLM